MRLIPALGLPGEATPPRRLRFAADFDVLRLALVRLVERLEERLRFDLLGTEVWWLGGTVPRCGAHRGRTRINEL